jgi:hypothetical protein
MTADDPPPPYVERYLVRKGIHGWMVWDRQKRGPASTEGRLEIGLTEEKARETKDELTRAYIAKG